MTFSLVSVAVLIFTAAIVLYEIARGIKRGFYASLINAAFVLLAVFLSLVISAPISDALAKLIYSPISSVEFITRLGENLPSISKIVFAYCDAIVNPFVFVFVFLVLRIVTRVALFIIKKKNPNLDGENDKDVKENSGWLKRHERGFNILVNTLCGVFIASILISPVMGTVKMFDRAVTMIESLDVQDVDTDELEDQLDDLIGDYKNDPVANVVYYCGGNIAYYASATSDLDGSYFAINRELKNTGKYFNKILDSARLMVNMNEATSSEIEDLKRVGKYINKSESLKNIAADFISGTAGAWLEGEAFMGLPRPAVTEAANPVINKVLYVCSKTTPRYVANDMTTLIELYLLFLEEGIIDNTNYVDLLSLFGDDSFLNDIKRILKKNPRMADIADAVDDLTVSMITAAVIDGGIGEGELNIIMEDISDAVNEVRHLPREDQIDFIKSTAYEAIRNSGLDVPEDMVEVTVEKLVDDIGATSGDITPDTIRAFFEKYRADLDLDAVS